MTRHKKRLLAQRIRRCCPFIVLIWFLVVFAITMELAKGAETDLLAILFVFLGVFAASVPVLIAERVMTHPKF